ncbi:permease [Halosquirtibacter xylanolyticus]|uniref:permease n=1 Tax=Halosquirtibacter xylanolyticus TaxID=3374599 RepID=UPI00374916F0|nr:permease [Prolixibacteraceae bacterium]
MQDKLIALVKSFFFDVLNIDTTPFMESLTKSFGNFIFITLELFILFVVITALIEFIMMHVSQTKLQRLFKGKGLLGNIAGAIFGAVTPFCACSTIPMTVGFLNANLPFGSVMSFLISSPLLNPIIVAMLGATVGVKNAAVYFILAFTLSVMFGYLLEKSGLSKYVRSVKVSGGSDNIVDGIDKRRSLSLGTKVRLSLDAGVNSLKPILGYLFIGVAIGATIYGYLPEGDTIAKYAGGDNIWAVPLAAIVGIPLYIRAETAIPIAMSLITKGVGMGTAISLIIGGAGMAIPEMTMLAKIFKPKLLIIFVAVIFLVAVISGYVFNVIV